MLTSSPPPTQQNIKTNNNQGPITPKTLGGRQQGGETCISSMSRRRRSVVLALISHSGDASQKQEHYKAPCLGPVVQGIGVTPDMGSGLPPPNEVADSHQGSAFSTNCRTLQAQGWGVQAGPSTHLPPPRAPRTCLRSAPSGTRRPHPCWPWPVVDHPSR